MYICSACSSIPLLNVIESNCAIFIDECDSNYVVRDAFSLNCGDLCLLQRYALW